VCSQLGQPICQCAPCWSTGWSVRDAPLERSRSLALAAWTTGCSRNGRGGEDGLKSHGQSGAVPIERTLSARVRQLGRPPMTCGGPNGQSDAIVLSHCARVQAAWTTNHSRDGRNDAPPRAASSRGSDRQPSGPRPAQRGLGRAGPSARAIERDPSPQGEGAAQTSNGEVVRSESPDLIRARHRARRHQGQGLRVVAMRPTLTAPARGAGGQPGRDEGAVTSDRTKELDRREEKSGWSLTRGIGLQKRSQPEGPRPASRGSVARALRPAR